MARGLIPKANDLVCAPGARVYVERLDREGVSESFEDNISCIHILATETSWSAEYFFDEADDGVPPEAIKKIIAAPRSYNPIPKPKYQITDVLEYMHAWDKSKEVMIDKVDTVEVIWYTSTRESAVRYVVKARGRDWIDEEDVIAQYVKKENTCESNLQSSEKTSSTLQPQL